LGAVPGVVSSATRKDRKLSGAAAPTAVDGIFRGIGSSVHWKKTEARAGFGAGRSHQWRAVDLTIPRWVASLQSPTLFRQTSEVYHLHQPHQRKNRSK
jgi:hypothetical protein